MNQDKIAHKIRNVRENHFRLSLNSVWSKTNIIKGTVGGVGAGQPTCKLGMFFPMSLALTMPIIKNENILEYAQIARNGTESKKLIHYFILKIRKIQLIYVS